VPGAGRRGGRRFVEILEGAEAWPGGLFPFDVRDQAGRLTPVAGVKLSEHLDRLAAVRAMLTDTLTGMSPQEFHRARSLPDYDVFPDWVVHHLMQHEAEHRGQIAELLGQAE
jgi:uncharacterized damage-inducible protein DinB